MNKPYLVGLTGGIGSGKSTAAKFFEDLGAKQLDLDAISKSLQDPGKKGYEELVNKFGDSCVDQASGQLDRAFLREAVFSYPECKKTVEGIMLPLIREEFNQQLLALAEEKMVIVNSPLLVEAPFLLDLVDLLVVVDCPEEIQIQRTMARSGLTRELIEKILKHQATRSQRLKVADIVIHNPTSDLEKLKLQVTHIYNRILKSLS